MDNFLNKSDSELINLTLKNSDFFSHIIDRYKDRLFAYIIRLSNISKEDAEDLLQEIFLKIYLNLNEYNDNLKFSSWIYRIAHNQVISRYRKTKSRPEGYLNEIDETLINKLTSNDDLLKEIDLKIDKKNIFKILYLLDYKYREVLILKYLEEKSYQEISDIIKKPSGTVASMINKAKEKFREVAKEKKINL